MLPIPGDRPLNLHQIADYWSRQSQPPASLRETRLELIRGWWRGEFVGNNGQTRLEVLRIIFHAQPISDSVRDPAPKAAHSDCSRQWGLQGTFLRGTSPKRRFSLVER